MKIDMYKLMFRLEFILAFVIYSRATLQFAYAEDLENKSIGPEDSLDRDDVTEEDEENFPFYSEWNDKMIGFHPKSLLSMNIAPKSSEFFYEQVQKSPTTVRGMFFTLSSDEDLNLALIIKSPSGEVVYSKDSSAGIFSFEATLNGVYEICITNTNWMASVGVTMAIGTDDHSVLQSKHIANTTNRIKSLEYNIDSIYSQFRYLWLHNHRQMNATKKAQGTLLLYAAGQFLVILACSLLSVWYVKRIVSNKRIL